jgi:hypothetical protein
MKHETARRFSNWALTAALIVIAGCIAVLLYWGLSSRDVLVIKNQPFPVRTIREHAKADGVIILQVSFCKKIHVEGRVRLSFVSASREVFLPASNEDTPPGCLDTEVPVLVPKEIIPDTYHIHFRITYKVNPLKQVTEEFDSKSFQVVP